LSAGVSHSVQYGLAALLKAVNDGKYKYRDDVLEYGEKACEMKKMFISNGFRILYDRDLDEPLADGFYFTIAYPGMSGDELIGQLLCYGVSAISLVTTGSDKPDGLRACVSKVPRTQFHDLEMRLKKFSEDHPLMN
jgi:hypothetical protein